MMEEWVRSFKEQINFRLDPTQATSDDELMNLVEEVVLEGTKNGELTAGQKWEMVHRIYHSYRGLDVLQPLIDDPTITEIMINSHREIFIERDGQISRNDTEFESRERLEDIIQSIVAKVNRTVNEMSPIVDARLQDGSRVNVVLPPVALKGPTMTIRKFSANPLTMESLIVRRALSEQAAELLQVLVQSKFNLFIGGGTGSGKTTFLNALSQWIPEEERIITIEDSAELQIRTVPNLVSLETRNANTEGKGEIGIRDLIRSSLRMRPNRIIVGEVRGAEAIEMLSAMNTGHDGSLSTGHANTSQDMLTRLETMVLSGAELPVEVIRKQISSAIDIMVHLTRMRDKSRKVTEISEVAGLSKGEVILNPLFVFDDRGEDADGKVIGELIYTGNPLINDRKCRMAGVRVPDWLRIGEGVSS
ncbi:CpaF family protein [Paenibacillus sp. FJAT-26967]|uniref:CpaF family protein n=1 Tax=Paenibacillus sp. FJAT-26967 TaxID=1729690 RepID=UPI000838B62A|nr:CpaF family protein [Paenibacillus sp. FJAT-26967]